MAKIGKMFIAIVAILVGFWSGIYWSEFFYNNICLDIGGKKDLNNHKICVVEKIIEKEKVVEKVVEKVIIKNDGKKYFCDKNGNKFVSENEAMGFGLEKSEFSEIYCK